MNIGIRVVVIHLLFVSISFSPDSVCAEGEGYDLSSLGNAGKTEYICRKEDTDHLVVIESPSGRRKTLSTKRAIFKLKRRIVKLQNRRREISNDASKKIKALQKRIKESRETRKQVVQCAQGIIPFTLSDPSGLITVQIPEAALPEGLDPRILQIFPDSWILGDENLPVSDVSQEGFNPEAAVKQQAMGFRLDPPTVFNEPGVTASLAIPIVTPPSEPGLFVSQDVQIRSEDELYSPEIASIANMAEFLREQVDDELYDLTTQLRDLERLGVVSVYNNITDSPSNNYRYITIDATIPDVVAVGDSFTVSFLVTRLVGVPSFLNYHTVTDGPWSIRSKISARGPVTPKEVDPAVNAMISDSDSTSFSVTYSCKERGLARFWMSSRGTAQDVLNGFENSSGYTTTFFNHAAFSVKCVIPSGGDTTDPDAACKTTNELEIDCQNGTTVIYAAAFIDPNNGSPTSFNLIDKDKQAVSSDNRICANSFSETAEAVDVSEVPQDVRDSSPVPEGKIAYWVKITISSTTPERGAFSLKVFCE